MRTPSRLLLASVAMVLAALGLTTPAHASPAPSRGWTSLASFEGRMIDLSKSWEGAQACAVISRTEVRCWASYEESVAELGAAKAGPGAQDGDISIMASSWHGCPADWLCIYEDDSWGGRMLQFNDEYWHSLAPYGFENKTSSWTNNQGGWWGGCSGSDTGILGNGAGDNRTLTDCSASSSLGSYNDKTKDVHG